ncbi:DNA polymerase I A, chloroplastic/mitochondrial-like [Cornus florida]|uniref:DNA polymerase I A, chloroplastic/mitochondrial-like n=1 Tax=Cornus florida TaxID=4283 RepID=UPI002897A1C9|nr:DNA polymerase I A, chloroplastic/mitochondrial-like [Cornus florida]
MAMGVYTPGTPFKSSFRSCVCLSQSRALSSSVVSSSSKKALHRPEVLALLTGKCPFSTLTMFGRSLHLKHSSSYNTMPSGGWELKVEPKARNPSAPRAFMVPLLPDTSKPSNESVCQQIKQEENQVPTHRCGNNLDIASETTQPNSVGQSTGGALLWAKSCEEIREKRKAYFLNNAQGKCEDLQDGSSKSTVPSSINVSGNMSNHPVQKDLNPELTLLKDVQSNSLSMKRSEERKARPERDAADAKSTAIADDADETYVEPRTGEEAQGVCQSHLHGKNAQGKDEGLQGRSDYECRSSKYSVPASINVSGSMSNHPRQKDLNSAHTLSKDDQPNGLLSENLSEERKETSRKLFPASTTDSADEKYIEPITDEEARGVCQSHLRERLAHIYDKVLVVDNISVAKEVVRMLTTQYRHHVYACDTEVAKIDVKQETPIDHGELICFSIFSEPAANFGNGKSCLWVDVLDGGGRSLLAEFAPFFEDPSVKKVWHNYSFDSHIVRNYGLKISGFHADTMHMARLWDSSRRILGGYSLEALTCDPKVMSGEGCHLDKSLIGKVSMVTIFGRRKVKKDGSEGKIITILPVEELQREERIPWICYSALDSISTLELYKSLKSKLVVMKWQLEGVCKGTMFDFYMKYWRPFGELLVEMETEGMLVDRAYFAEIEKVARAEQQVAVNRFRNWASKYCPNAKYMNVGSDAQLRQLFFGGITNRKDPDKSLPFERNFKVPNIHKEIEEGKKTPAKFLNIKLHSLGPEIQTELYTASGWPSVSGDALKTLAGKVSAEFDFIDEAHELQSDENVGKMDQTSNGLSEIKERAASGDKESAYGTAYAPFGGGQNGKEACHAIAALCEVCSIDSLISNFIIPLQGSHISGKNGRVHCSLNINTETGRLSARRPNLQNQPALEKDRYKIRQAFIAAPGNSLIVADYGQLELRILAHLADCKSMLHAFKAGGDFHSRTAMNMYPHIREAIEQKRVLLEWYPQPGEDKPPVPLLKDAFASERRKAKMLNFSIAYGKTPVGLARDWKVSEKEAKQTVDLWYSERQEVLQWQKKRKWEAKYQKCVHTLLGRARRFPSMDNATSSQRGHIERAAINTPVQGSAADVAMCAMLEISKNERLKEIGWRLLLQVHDEVILEGPEESADIAKAIVVECMSKPFDGKNILKVDLSVDAKCAQNWYSGK